MPYAVKSGAKILGTVKRKTKRNVNRLLAKEYRKDNKVSILPVARKKK